MHKFDHKNPMPHVCTDDNCYAMIARPSEAYACPVSFEIAMQADGPQPRTAHAFDDSADCACMTCDNPGCYASRAVGWDLPCPVSYLQIKEVQRINRRTEAPPAGLLRGSTTTEAAPVPPKIWRLFLLYQKVDVHRTLLFERSQREGLKIPEDSYASFDGYQFYRPLEEHCGPSWGSLMEDPPQNEDLGKRLLRLERRYRQVAAWSGRIADAMQAIAGSSRFAYQYNERIVTFTIANRSLDFIDVQLLKDI